MVKIARMKINEKLYNLDVFKILPKMLVLSVEYQPWNNCYLIVFECEDLKVISNEVDIPLVNVEIVGEKDLLTSEIVNRFVGFVYEDAPNYKYKLDKKEVKECQTFLTMMQKLWKKLFHKK